MMNWRYYGSEDKGYSANLTGEAFLKSLICNKEQAMGGKMNVGGGDLRWNGADGWLVSASTIFSLNDHVYTVCVD